MSRRSARHHLPMESLPPGCPQNDRSSKEYEYCREPDRDPAGWLLSAELTATGGRDPDPRLLATQSIEPSFPGRRRLRLPMGRAFVPGRRLHSVGQPWRDQLSKNQPQEKVSPLPVRPQTTARTSRSEMSRTVSAKVSLDRR